MIQINGKTHQTYALFLKLKQNKCVGYTDVKCPVYNFLVRQYGPCIA